MTVDIFCCTYAQDARWLEYMLRSCQKYARGFRQAIVVYPSRDRETLAPICDRFPFVKPVEFNENGDGHTYQNEIKTSCDLYSDADYFLLIDSDCAFLKTVTPDYFFTDGKFDVTYVHYDHPSARWQGGRLPWKEITDAALGRECLYETMQQFPFMYPRWLFSDVRSHIEQLHDKTFHNYVHSAPHLGRAWHGYSEFCTLGAFALCFCSDKMCGYDRTQPNCKPKVVKNFWSHSKLTPQEQRELESITAGWQDCASTWN